MKSDTTNDKKKEIIEQSTRDFQNLNEDSQMFILGYPMRRKTPCFSYGDIRRVHRIYASN